MLKPEADLGPGSPMRQGLLPCVTFWLEIPSQQRKFSRESARLGRGLHVDDLAEPPLENRLQAGICPACENLGDQRFRPRRARRRARSAAASQSAMILTWSVCLCPDEFVAMSDITTSAPLPPSQSRTRSSAAFGEKIQHVDFRSRDRLDCLQVDCQ